MTNLMHEVDRTTVLELRRELARRDDELMRQRDEIERLRRELWLANLNNTKKKAEEAK